MKEVGGITGVHCENDGLISALQEEYESYGGDVSCHYKTRPACAEAEAIGRLLYFCEAVNIPVIDVHLTCEEELNEIRAARKRGQTVYSETCPQYLLMTRELYGFSKIPGVETRGELIYSEGVAKWRISAVKMCEVLCENPAKLYGLYPQKGVIQEGSDADIVILKPSGTKTITHSTQVSRCDYLPFEGMNITGTIESVYLRGVLIALWYAPSCNAFLSWPYQCRDFRGL